MKYDKERMLDFEDKSKYEEEMTEEEHEEYLENKRMEETKN